MMGEPFAADLWTGLAALLLVTAVIAYGLELFRVRGRWALWATGATIGAVIALAVALVVIATTHGRWWQSPLAVLSLDPRQVVLGLALATLAVHLVLAWRLPVDATGLVVVLLALVLVLIAGFMVEASELSPDCDQRTIPLQLQWALFLAGTGGLAVAGSAGLTLALRAGLARRIPRLQWPLWIDLHALLERATALALASLGAGLAVSLWWSWQLRGALCTTHEPREGWVIVALLVAAMSFLARRTGGRWGRWSAGLAMVAASVAILGLLTGLICCTI